MGSGLEENASISKEIRSKFEDLELQPRKAAGAVEALEPSDDGRNSVYKEESENRGRENRGTSNPSSGSDVVAERPEVEGHGRMDEAADGAADEQDGIQDDADVLEASEPGSPLDPDMIQLAKERNKAAGICDACQELFAAICTVGSDREGGKALAPAGYEKYDEGSSYILWPKGDKPTLHNFAHDTLPALTVSAKTGCGTCRMLLESLRVYSSPKYCEPSSDWFVAASYKKFKGHDQWLIWLHSKESSIEKADGYRLDLIPTYANHFKQSRSSFGQFEQNPFPDSLPSASPEIPRHSLESLPLAKIWLNHCEVNHRSCNTSRTVANSFFPTRLLFVGEAIPRLCLTSTLPRSRPLRYSALSHCWGSLDGLICLTAQNLVAFQNIPAPALCKTFRDAIEITKALGLDYLWIDSLCIIQDDVGDWTSEAGLMCEVYSCCAVSIAASSALNGNGGCLFSRDPERCWAQPLEMIQNRKLVECSLLNTGIRMQCVDDVPLSTRAVCIFSRFIPLIWMPRRV
jgi:hypothetical protein